MAELINREIIAFDGEGAQVDEEQLYIMLVASNGQHIIDVDGLSTEDCLTFLWNNSQKRLAVGYGFSYDINMMLRDVDPKKLFDLYQGREIFAYGFHVQYVHSRTLKIRKEGYEYGITIWDTLPFFQTSFINALDSYGIDYDKEAVAKGKSQRGTFTREEAETFIFSYCLEECKALKSLINTLCQYLQTANLVISRFDGTGAIAAKLLETNHVKKHLTECEEHIQIAAQHAYSGGRMECFKYGHTEETIYHYDINSAYPNAATLIPSLTNGNWVPNTKQRITDFSLFLVEWDLPESPIYPFSYRNPDMSIIYPQQGLNWVWGAELKAFFDCADKPKVKILESYRFEPAEDIKPFEFLEEVYKRRQEWKKAGIGAEKVLKLAINSVYGKLAQQVGYNVATGKKPPFYQLEYAGFITAYTRSMLYRAMMQSPSSIICCATDGIYSLEPLNLPLSSNLGEWSFQKHNSMTIVQSGVYWLDEGEEETAYYRGFDKGTVNRKEVLEHWHRGESVYKAKTTRFRTLGTSLRKKGEILDRHCRWETIERELALTMRNFNTKRIDLNQDDLSCRLSDTVAQFNSCYPCISEPFPLAWITLDPANEQLAKDLEASV